MGSELSEANMDALNRNYEDRDRRSRRSSARVESHHRRGVGRRHYEDMDRYDENYINFRNASTLDEPRRRRGMESRHLAYADELDEEDIYPRQSSTRGVTRMRQDIGFEAMDRPSPDNFPHAPIGGHRSTSRTTAPYSPLPELLAELEEAEGDEEEGKEAMRRSLKGSVAYNQGREKSERAKLRIKQVKKEARKHDPDKVDMNEFEGIARHHSSRDERHYLAGGSSRSHRGPTSNRTGDYDCSEYASGHGGGHDPRHGYGGRSRRSDFY